MVDDLYRIAEVRYNECEIVRAFLQDTVLPIVAREYDGAQQTAERHTYFSTLERVLAWLNSIERLSRPGDFQASAAGARAMLEIAVDLTLLHLDPSNYPHMHLLTWEDSAKLQAAERVRKFFDGKPVPPPHKGALQFIVDYGPRITAERQRIWNNTKHPSRWTGHRGFSPDVDAADRLMPKVGFRYVYAATFAHLCWNTHGSALVGVRTFDAPGFAATVGLNMELVVRFAVLAAMHVADFFGVLDDDLQAHFTRVTAHRSWLATAAAAAMASAKEEQR